MSARPEPVPPVVTLFETCGAGATLVGVRAAAVLGVHFLGQDRQLETAAEASSRTPNCRVAPA
jgi:hypothetical protein